MDTFSISCDCCHGVDLDGAGGSGGGLDLQAMES